VLFIGLALRLGWMTGRHPPERTPQTSLKNPPHDATLPLRPSPTPASGERHDWQTIKKLLPYLWAWKWRVMFALGCLISAKFANVTVPLIFKQLVDGLDISRDQAVIVVPAALLAAYGALRFSTSMFTELREIVFARVTQQAVREISLQVFRHLHACRCASTSSARPAA
jgi:ATP-binding cassette subfamily B protein